MKTTNISEVLLFVSIIIVLISHAATSVAFSDLKDSAIVAGVARYNPTNARFEWVLNK